MSADYMETYAKLRAIGTSLHVAAEAQPLVMRSATLRAGTAIPPREWLYGTLLVRRYVSVVVAPGGVGKTAYSVAVACAVARGRAVVGEWVHRQANVLVCNLEDPEDEFDRRIAACMERHGISEADLRDRLFVINGRERRLVLASIGEDGMTIAYPDKDALAMHIREENIGLIIVDPFVNSHELDENSNPHVNAAARAWAEIADATGCAVLLIHHTRKGAIAGDMDSGRGASALMGAARSALTLSAMTSEEAKEFGVPEGERRRHIRLDDAKANLAPPAASVKWLRLASVELGNGTPDYPNGDSVQAAEEWEAPEAFKMLSEADCNAALDVIGRGPGGGVLFTTSRRGGGNRWAGQVLMDNHDLTDGQAAKVIGTWITNGVLEERTYTDPEQRKKRLGLFVNDAKRPG